MAKKPLTDKELWDRGCITRYQLKRWTASDYRQHFEGIKNSLEVLMTHMDEPDDPTSELPTPPSNS